MNMLMMMVMMVGCNTGGISENWNHKNSECENSERFGWCVHYNEQHNNTNFNSFFLAHSREEESERAKKKLVIVGVFFCG